MDTLSSIVHWRNRDKWQIALTSVLRSLYSSKSVPLRRNVSPSTALVLRLRAASLRVTFLQMSWCLAMRSILNLRLQISHSTRPSSSVSAPVSGSNSGMARL